MAEAAAVTGRPAAIVEMIQAGEVVLGFDLAEQSAGVLSLLKKYADREMDLADACIVRMTEVIRDCRVVTVDRADFAVYRRNGHALIPVIAPPAAKRLARQGHHHGHGADGVDPRRRRPG